MKYFSGSIAGKKLVDFQQYEASIEKLEERKGLVGELILDENGNVHSFFSTYFNEYYGVSPTQKDWMAEQDAVCRTLEMLGTYILNAKDIESNRKVKYRFWRSEREFKSYKESQNVVASVFESGGNEGSDFEVFDMFYSNDDKNYKKSKDTQVYSKDIKEIVEIGRLQDMVERASSDSFIKMVENKIDASLSILMEEDEKARLIKIRKNVKNYVSRWVREMKDNQIAIKKAIKRPIDFKNVLKDEGAPNKLDTIDFMEEGDIKTLLPYLSREDLMSDIGIIVYDLNKLIDRTKLSVREQEVVNLYREGLKQTEVADELKINKASVRKMEYRISEKTAKTYEKQVEEYRDRMRKNKKGC
ncbi:helix-turn-helix transcriptional regulator [Bacillus cereus]|uniref:helix-turn-helix transcriptional regulator n=1 Tax=Bacillus cereus TaxID=1396 RepID=UPI0036311899